MTVIVTLITRYCTVHASDSFITELQPDGTCLIREAERTKIVPVEGFHGAMAYWGVAKIPSRWSTYDWLAKQAGRACDFRHPEDFANHMADELNKRFSKLPVERKIDLGIGIHFTAYEYVQDHWIPELFVLSNFSDPTYQELHKEGVIVNRQTYNTISQTKPRPEHREAEFRLRVRTHLQDGEILIYNNGDPLMFNPAADALFQQISEIRKRGSLKAMDDVSTYRKIAKIPIKMVSKVQRELYRSEFRVVGGKIHDLSITPHGEYFSDSGD